MQLIVSNSLLLKAAFLLQSPRQAEELMKKVLGSRQFAAV